VDQDLECGNYIVMVSTFEPNVETKFKIKIEGECTIEPVREFQVASLAVRQWCLF
jgi:hypothetical protein